MGEILLESLRLHLDLGAGEERVCAALGKADRKEKEEFCDRLLLEALLVDALAKKGHASGREVKAARRLFWPVFGVAAVAALLMIIIGFCWLRQTNLRYPAPELAARTESGRIVTMKAPERGQPVEAGPVVASLRLGGYCNLSLDPAARLVLRGSPRKEAVEVVEGRVTARVAPHVGEFTVYTPIGRIRVKGTEFTTVVEHGPSSQGKGGDARGSATVTVVVVSGAVEYSFGSRSGLLQGGQSQVFVAEKPVPAVALREERASVAAAGQQTPAPQAGVSPDEAMPLYGQAVKMMRGRDDAGAMEILKQVVSRYPKSNWAGCALRHMGTILMKQQQYDRAIEAFRRGMTEYPDARFGNGGLAASFSAYDVASCLYLKGDEDEAFAAFEEAVKKYPDATSVDARLLSDMFMDLVERGGAAPRTGQAGQPPDEARALYFEGVRRDKQDPEGAMQIFQQVLAQYPRSNWAGCALADIGFIFKRQEKYDEAVEVFRRAQREYPESKYGTGKMVAPTAVYNIVHCLGLKGDVERARKAYEEAVKMYPNAAAENGKLLRDIFPPPADEGDALYVRAEGLRQNRPEDAVKAYQELVSKYPKHRLAGAALTNSARTLYRLGRFEEAVAAMKRVIAEYPDARFWSGGLCAMSAAYEVGGWYYEKKDMENAKKAFEFALSKYPDASYAKSPSYIKMMKELGVDPVKAGGKARQGADAGRELYYRGNRLSKEKPDEALKAFDELLARYPQHAMVGASLVNQGGIYMDTRRYDEAIANFRKVVEEHPNSTFNGGVPTAPTAAWLIVVCYHAKGDMPNAKKALDFALQKYPDAQLKGQLRSERYARMIKQINETTAK